MNDQSTVAYARKRLVQGLRGLNPKRAGEDVDRGILELLTREQRSRFGELPAFDQQHLCRVANHLVEQGVTDRDLLVAGLLHDIGKSDGQTQVRLADRVAKVLLKRASPGTLQSVARDYPSGRFPGLALTMLHPQVGADRARAMGCSDRTCWLIRHHEADTDLGDPDLARLQAADFAS
ncbi:MAG: HD domain-containing protein [Thermomicrobiales bacterium]|nr:MAG: HD domain-containing protein [Thermomicrobiales bacterium]